MDENTTAIRDRILEALLPTVVFDGWTWPAAGKAARDAGFDETMALAVFPGGLEDVLDHFSAWADRRMLDRLGSAETRPDRIRDRVRGAALARFEALQPWKEAVRLATRHAAMPHRAARAARRLWRAADAIWTWAGDESRDYNRYTKRALLSGVLASTNLAWLADREKDMRTTAAFLDRRIENVMQVGRALGRIRKTG